MGNYKKKIEVTTKTEKFIELDLENLKGISVIKSHKYKLIIEFVKSISL